MLADAFGCGNMKHVGTYTEGTSIWILHSSHSSQIYAIHSSCSTTTTTTTATAILARAFPSAWELHYHTTKTCAARGHLEVNNLQYKVRISS